MAADCLAPPSLLRAAVEFLPNGAFVQDKPRLRRVAHRFSARDSAADLPARDAASAAVATPFARAEDAGGWEEG